MSNNDNITLSPVYGGRKKRNGESGQLQRLNPQKQIGRTFTGENSLFSPLVIGVCLLLWLSARGENRLFSPVKVRPICFCGTKRRSCPQSGQLTKYKSFACGERRLQSKKKSRLAAGDAPEQVASLSVFGDYQKLLVIFYT